MKNLVDILLEKLDINNINIDAELPKDFNYDDVIAYLHKNRFNEIEYTKNGVYIFNNIPFFNSKKGKYFMTSSAKEFFIADTSKGDISKKNPLVYIEWDYLKPNNRRIVLFWGELKNERKIIDENELYKYL